jgi:hypothetical protein
MGFKIHCEERRALMDSLQTALLFRRRCLLDRALSSLFFPSQAARHHYKISLQSRTLTCWRRLVTFGKGLKASGNPLGSSSKYNQSMMVKAMPLTVHHNFGNPFLPASSWQKKAEPTKPIGSPGRHQHLYYDPSLELQLFASSSDLLMKAGKLSAAVASHAAMFKPTRSCDSNVSSIAISLADLCKSNSRPAAVAPPEATNAAENQVGPQAGMLSDDRKGLTQDSGCLQSSATHAKAGGELMSAYEGLAIQLAKQWHGLKIKLRVVRAWVEFHRFQKYRKDVALVKCSVANRRISKVTKPCS